LCKLLLLFSLAFLDFRHFTLNLKLFKTLCNLNFFLMLCYAKMLYWDLFFLFISFSGNWDWLVIFLHVKRGQLTLLSVQWWLGYDVFTSQPKIQWIKSKKNPSLATPLNKDANSLLLQSLIPWLRCWTGRYTHPVYKLVGKHTNSSNTTGKSMFLTNR